MFGIKLAKEEDKEREAEEKAYQTYNNYFYDSVAVFSLDYTTIFIRIFMLCFWDLKKR